MSMFKSLINTPLAGLKLESMGDIYKSEDSIYFKSEDSAFDDEESENEEESEDEESTEEDEDSEESEDEESEETSDEDMKKILTPVLLGETLTEAEIEDFRESMDSELAIQDGYVTERTIVKMDKKARKSQLLKVATITIAREKKDPLYKKLALVWKMERRLEALIAKKYKSQAQQKVTKYIQDAKKSKVGAIKNAAMKLMGKKK